MQRGIDIFEGLLTSAVGTKRTCRGGLTMSAVEPARAERTFRASGRTSVFDPTRTWDLGQGEIGLRKFSLTARPIHTIKAGARGCPAARLSDAELSR
jgi:hypothetical protein